MYTQKSRPSRAAHRGATARQNFLCACARVGTGGEQGREHSALRDWTHFWNRLRRGHSPSQSSRPTRNNVPEVRRARQASPLRAPLRLNCRVQKDCLLQFCSCYGRPGRGRFRFPLRTRGSWDEILLNRAHLHAGARASREGRGKGPAAAARAPAASIVLLRGEAARRGKRGGRRSRARGGDCLLRRRHINKRLSAAGAGAGWARGRAEGGWLRAGRGIPRPRAGAGCGAPPPARAGGEGPFARPGAADHAPRACLGTAFNF